MVSHLRRMQSNMNVDDISMTGQSAQSTDGPRRDFVERRDMYLRLCKQLPDSRLPRSSPCLRDSTSRDIDRQRPALGKAQYLAHSLVTALDRNQCAGIKGQATQLR
jgi:hypothetical protein